MMKRTVLAAAAAALFFSMAAFAEEVTRTLNVEGLDCAKCDKAVAQKLSAMKGVKSAKASHEKGTVSFTFDNAVVKGPDIRKAINEMKGTCKPLKVTGVERKAGQEPRAKDAPAPQKKS